MEQTIDKKILNTTDTIIHVHSHHSLKDSPMKIDEMCKRAKEMGVKNLTLTDHGSCTGWMEFIYICKQYDLNPIPGIEAYVKTNFADHAHMILLARDYEGYQAISRAITEAHEHQINNGGVLIPVMDMEILQKHFQNNTHVFATSACINGVVAGPMRNNTLISRQTEKLERKKVKYDTVILEDYKEKRNEENNLKEEVQKLTAKKEEIAAIAKKSFAGRERRLSAMNPENPEYLSFKQELENEINKTNQAKKDLTALTKQLADVKRRKTILHKELTSMQAKIEKIEKIDADIEEYNAKRLTDKQIAKYTEDLLKQFVSIFSKNFFIELQYHGMEEEKTIMQTLARLAEAHSIPVIAANDAHLVSQEQAEARAVLHALRFSEWEEPNDIDKELYLKTDQELFASLSQILDEQIALRAIYNTRILGDACHVELPTTTHYPRFRDENGEIVSDAKKVLEKHVQEGIERIFHNKPFSKEYQERLSYEMDVICSLGYADYFLIEQDFIRFAKEHGKLQNKFEIGYSVGPGRGSAPGSLVCYLLGITAIDPIQYGLIFERFLNKDRVTMPDIDVDYSDETRDAVIEYAKERYGKDSVASIRTVIMQKSKNAIRDSARVRGYEVYGNLKKNKEKTDKETEAAWDRNMASMRSVGERISADLSSDTDSIKDCKKDLLQKYGDDKNALTIINRAESIEGTIKTTGAHAAGVIIGDGSPLKDIVPLMYNKASDQWAVQCDMVEAERDLGLLKMDFLTITNLNVINDCIRLVKDNTGETVPIENLPIEPEVFAEIFSKGNTESVFQFGSQGMRQMLREFKPSSFEDIILLAAAYRPGPMQFLPDIIKRKHGKEKITYLTPELEDILNTTYGAIIYQEQVMFIFQKLAGYSFGQADNVRKAMSKKKEEELVKEKKAFICGDVERNIVGCKKNGIEEKKAEELFDEILDFASYAFNKAHATVYAYIAYQTAYLKYHYPLQYMCAVINHANVSEYPNRFGECRKYGIQIAPPDMNRSSLDFHVDHVAKEIVYGLRGIKGLDVKTAENIIQERKRNGLYFSFANFVLRSHAGKGACEKLIKAGAMDRIEHGRRTAFLEVAGELVDDAGVAYKKEKLANDLSAQWEEKEKELLEVSNSNLTTAERNAASTSIKKEMISLEKRIGNAREARERAEERMEDIYYSSELEDDKDALLKEEKELLGCYISDHPMSGYEYLYNNKNIVKIADAQIGKMEIIGIISGVRMAKRKSDGKNMAFLTLEDMTGSIPVCVFTKTYEKYSDLIQEGNIIKVFGHIEKESDAEESPLQMRSAVIEQCAKEQNPLLISILQEDAEDMLMQCLDVTKNETGRPVLLYPVWRGGKKYCRVEKTNYRVGPEFLQMNIENVKMQILNLNRDLGDPTFKPKITE